MGSKTAKVKGLLSKGFKSDKCKTSIKMSMARMKLMRNKRDVQVKHVRRDVAQLLQSGDESTARIRVDHVIRDEKTISAYELLEVYCELIIQRLHIIDSQKICPIDLKEAIATVVFAAPRCADIPELSDVAKHFQAKYGKEFFNAALELRPGSGVSPLIIDKLSASSANIETKVKVLKSIAEENNIKWEAKGFEEEAKAPRLVRLDGSSKFLKVSETAAVQPGPTQIPPPATTYQPQNYTHHANVATVQPGPTQTPPPVTTYQPQNYTHHENVATVQPGPTQTQPPATTYQPQNYTHHENVAYQPTRPNNSSSGTQDPPLATPSQVVRPQSNSRYSESQYVSEEEAEKSPPDLPDHNAYYSSVEEAAEAAAKSAEIASKAAKAAAAMARHGSLSREQSNVSSKSYSSRDSPKKKHDMEEVSFKPETFSAPSMQKNTSWDAKEPQVGPFKPTPDRAPVGPPSPHSSTSSSGYGESYEVTPRPASRKSPEYSNSKEGPFSKQKSVVQKEEEYDFSDTNTRYNNSNSQENKAFHGPTWDDNRYEEEPDIVSSNIRLDSFDDSRFETYDRPVYEEESFFRVERKDSFASKEGTAWFSSDNFSYPKLPKSGSVSNNSSSLLFTSNTSEWDPPRSPVDKGSGTKFDKGPTSPSSGSLFNDDNPTLLSVLSGRGLSQSRADEDSGPKFDSGPNFDSDVHVEEEKVVVEEEEYFVGTSPSPRSHAKERTKGTFISSSDDSHMKKSPLSMRTKDSSTNRSEMVQPRITKEPRVKAEKAPLGYYTRKGNSSDDDDNDSGNQQLLDYDNNKIIGGRRNRPGYTRPPYTLKPLEEEPKPSNRRDIMKSMADLSVEEERIYTPRNSNSRDSEDRRKEASRRSALRYTPNRRNFDEEEEEMEEVIVQPAKIKVYNVPSSLRVPDYGNLKDEEETEEEVVKSAKIKLKEPSSSRVSKDYLGNLRENKLDYEEPSSFSRRAVGSSVRDSRPTRGTSKEEPLEVRKDEPPMEKTKKESSSKSSESRGPLRYIPPGKDSDEKEQLQTMPRKESMKSSLVDKGKEKVELKEKEEQVSAQPIFPRATFPLDMDALRARVQHIKATMNDP